MNTPFQRLLVALGLRNDDPAAEARAQLLRWAEAHESSSPSLAADLRAAALACPDGEAP